MPEGVVQFPPSFSRRAAPALLPLFFLLPSAVTSAWGLSTPWGAIGMYGVIALGYLLWAWSVRHRPPLVLDDTGLRDEKGTLLIAWRDVALVWFGDHSPRLPAVLRATSLQVWDDPALAFAERTGFPPLPKVIRMVPTTLSTAEGAELIRRFTAAPVHTGDGTDLRRLVTQLRQAPRT